MKEYLKMGDCFEMPLAHVETNNGMHSVIDSAGDRISCEFLCDAELEVVLHAINSHDELVAEVERLTKECNQLTSQLFEADAMVQEMQGIIDSQ